MEKVLENYLGVQNLNPYIVEAIHLIDNGLTKVNDLSGQYEAWQLILITSLSTYLLCRFYDYYEDLEHGLMAHLKQKLFKIVKKIPFLSNKIMQELDKTRKELEDGVIKANKGNSYIKKLPVNGSTEEEVLAKIDTYMKMNTVDWKDGSLSGCVYGADDHLTKLTTKVYEKFCWSNPLHADVFPEVRKMEAEVVRMVCDMFNGDAESCGTMSSGGTESIMLACRAYRDLAYEKGIKKPEMVIPITAHAAFDKAANYFKIKINHVPVDPITTRVNIKKLKSYINSNTCMIVGSAPNFPSGAIDSIEELSEIAVKYGIPLHVDSCLGGFLIPFMEEAGYKLPLFDFRLPGVTSISCDTHKYGYTPKGSSVIMYRNAEFRRYQYFSAVEWPGGIYVSPTFAGSRPGSLIAMTWATLISFGRNGYVKATKEVIDTVLYITKELKAIKEIHLVCEPDVSVVAFDSKDFNILKLHDEMTEKGWNLNALQNPVGIHIAVTKLHTQKGIAERFVNDIRKSVKNIMEQPDRKLGKTAAMYCSAASVPDKSLITDVAFLFLDACYSTKERKIENGKH